MKFFFGLAIANFLIIKIINSESSCDHLGVHFYEQLKCESKGCDKQMCPESFDCPEYRVPEGKCLFKGLELNNGDIADGSYCNKGCVCQSAPGMKGKFWCGLIIDCYFGPMDSNCYFSKDLGQCCGQLTCPPYSNVTCKIDGKEYRDGEEFTPKGTCWNCVCKAGFAGKFEAPYCMRRPCDMELRFSNELEIKCAPLYQQVQNQEDALCCPRGFICEENTTIRGINKVSNKSKEKCQFGKRTFHKGDKFQVDYIEHQIKKSAACSCRIPPLISCTLN